MFIHCNFSGVKPSVVNKCWNSSVFTRTALFAHSIFFVMIEGTNCLNWRSSTVTCAGFHPLMQKKATQLLHTDTSKTTTAVFDKNCSPSSFILTTLQSLCTLIIGHFFAERLWSLQHVHCIPYIHINSSSGLKGRPFYLPAISHSCPASLTFPIHPPSESGVLQGLCGVFWKT